MKNFFKKLFELLKEIFKEEEKKETIEEPKVDEIIDIPVIEQIEIVEPTLPQVKEEELVSEVKATSSKKAYKMLTNKERQTYLKALGLYTKSIDSIRGEGQKKAEKYFNIIFLNKNTTTYYEETDKLLREVYASYKKSKYMVATDWKYFKNVKKKELYCTCNKKYCDGYNGLEKKIPMRLIMLAQYKRNISGQPIYISSSIRCAKRNAEIGGIKKSKHLEFRAIDHRLGNLPAKETIRYKLPYVNYTYEINKNYVHADINI